MTVPEAKNVDDWNRWHDSYDDTNSELADRLRLVRQHVVAAVDTRSGRPVSVVSICAGQGRELIGALENHPRRTEVTGLLVEADQANASFARQWAERVGMAKFRVVHGDASLRSSYDSLDRADLVVLSGVFGHLDDHDVQRTIAFLRELCLPGSSVIWTSYEVHPERTQFIRETFMANSFENVTYARTAGGTFGVTEERYTGKPLPRRSGQKIFTFGSSRQAAT